MSSPSAQSASGPDLHGQLMQFATGYMPSICLYAAAKLKIADLLAAGPKPVSELARASRANEGALYRILRALASLGVFRETALCTFANTPLSETIRSDVAGSARDTVLFMADPMHMRVFAEMMHSVETGGTAFKKATGMGPFEFFQQNGEENAAFNAAMTSITSNFVPPVIAAYDFGESGTLADVGGGHGILLAMILQKHRGLRGIVYDLPHVVEGATPRIESLGLASRCEVVGGDFFEAVPQADSYVMKSIIHDWDDARAITILKNCAKAMRGPNGKVILIEYVIVPGNEPDVAKWIDLEMLAMAGGRERTEAEYADLFAKAGLRLARVVRSSSPFCAIEAVKA
ncbi:MAG TPA: methyltransferase [Candidatus Acidoferrales bacterium]|nr:methyltransferase [Candidatus Acidoferrales bacterium]